MPADLTPDLRAEALALCEKWDRAQNHLEVCALRTRIAPEPVACDCGHVHRLEVIGCQLARALAARLAVPPAAGAPHYPDGSDAPLRDVGTPSVLAAGPQSHWALHIQDDAIRLVVAIQRDGSVQYGPGYTTDQAAARLFWETMAREYPSWFAPDVPVPAASAPSEEYLDALEVLCRVFDDGADERHDKWLAWYDPTKWLHPSRALGAFIRRELDAEKSVALLAEPSVEQVAREYVRAVLGDDACTEDTIHYAAGVVCDVDAARERARGQR